MRKFCVFCGEKPKSKSNEHIIPQWLIELTGNPKRIAFFGYEKWLNPDSNKLAFSFDSFKFPSCSSCNQKFAALEDRTKLIIHKVLLEEPVSSVEFNILLDWFDKVRIGLWLGYQYLNKNPLGISPKFHIKQRIGIYDRMLAIYKTDETKSWLHFIGCSTPSFYFTPSCFALCINNFVFLNLSLESLFSRRIGFPYPSKSFFVEYNDVSSEPILFCHFSKGRERFMLPLLKMRIRIKTAEIYQPMYPQFIGSPEIDKLYKTEYVVKRSICPDKGIGKVFMQYKGHCEEYSEKPSRLWVPTEVYDQVNLVFDMRLLVIEWQMYLDSLMPSLKMLSKERRNHILKTKMFRHEMNENALKAFRSEKLK